MDKNTIWHYYHHTEMRFDAICKQCIKRITKAGQSTSGLHGLQKSQHKINVLKRNNEEQLNLQLL